MKKQISFTFTNTDTLNKFRSKVKSKNVKISSAVEEAMRLWLKENKKEKNNPE